MNPILLRYAGVALVAAIFGIGGGFFAVNNKASRPEPPSGTTVAVPAQSFPGQKTPAIPTVPVIPGVHSEGENKITVLTPNGGETFCDISQPGSEGWWNVIEWSGNTDRGVKIALLRPEASSDKDPTPHIVGWIVAGQIYTGVKGYPGNTYTFNCTWEVTNETFTEGITVIPGKYKILVVADDGKGKFVLWNKNANMPATNYDMSDQSFTIAPKPKVKVIFPNGGEALKIGDTVSIRFEADNIPNHGMFNVMDVWLLKPGQSRASGEGLLLQKVGIKPGTGTYVYEWKLWPGVYKPGDYLIEIDDIGGWIVASLPEPDKSDTTFRLVAP